jgi:hypothetical protein
LLWRPL